MNSHVGRIIVAIVSGTIAGFAGVALHNAFQPWGALLALFTLFTTLSLLGRAYHSHGIKVLAALAAMGVLIRASTHGVSFEILVYGNRMGNFYTLASTALLIYCCIRREWKSSVTSKL